MLSNLNLQAKSFKARIQLLLDFSIWMSSRSSYSAVKTDQRKKIVLPPEPLFLCYGSSIQVPTQNRNVGINLDRFPLLPA